MESGDATDTKVLDSTETESKETESKEEPEYREPSTIPGPPSSNQTNQTNQTNKIVAVPKPYKSINKPIRQLQLSDYLKRGPSVEMIVVDNFYNNPMETRNYILSLPFSVKGNYPGQRTRSFATEELKNIIQKYVRPYGKITYFPIPKKDGSDADKIYNGSFQYTTSRDRSWIHTDRNNNWAGIVYLTPDAPLSSGTGFYRFKDGAMNQMDGDLLGNHKEADNASQDVTKWELVDQVGNVFNRLVLFNGNRYHCSMDYFGSSKEDGRLFQLFFFDTQRE